MVDFQKLKKDLIERRIQDAKKATRRRKELKKVVAAKTWSEHKDNWTACKLCDLCDTRSKVVLARGKLPCDVLIVARSPGSEDNALGKPLIGDGGKLLDEMIDEAKHYAGSEVRVAYTTLVACRSVDSITGKAADPTREYLEACKPRLRELVNIAKPRAIVMVGKFSQKWCPKLIDHDFEFSVDIIHPDAMIQMDASQRPLIEQRTMLTLRDLFISMR